MKALFEATNGYTGNSYVRCYVWADSEEEAMVLARAAFSQPEALRNDGGPKGVTIERLFQEDTPSFATVVSDDGWDAGDE